MDNLTHSLIGAALGQAGLKRKTGLAMPALIIGANLPDIDAACFFWLEGPEHLGFRRGITHGPPAMLLLPLLLAGALWGFDRWQTGRGTRPAGRLPIRFGWLYLLSLIACLSHPLFDWFNVYGVRLLEPFSHQWFYGDTLFIIDIWIVLMLGAGIWHSLRRERGGHADWTRPVQLSWAGVIAYLLGNMVISNVTAMKARGDDPYPTTVVASPVPFAFWRREVLWRTEDGYYGAMPCTVIACERYPRVMRKTNADDPRIAVWATDDSQAEAFLFWSRMPVAVESANGIVLRDQRFMGSPVRSRFTVTLRPPKP